MTQGKRHYLAGAALLAAAFSLSACSSSAPAAPAVTSATAEATSTSITTSVPTNYTSTTSSPAVAAAAALGQVQSGQAASYTVLEVKDKIESHSDFGADQRWFGAHAKTCFKDAVGPDGATLSWSPWSVIGSDGGRYPASSSQWEDFPSPKYSSSAERYKAGECVQGWILFAVKKDVTVTAVRYANASGDVFRCAAQ